MNGDFMSEESSSIISTVDDKNSGVYNTALNSEYIHGNGYDFFGKEENFFKTAHLNKRGLEIVWKLFFLLKNEFSYFSHIRGIPKNIFERTEYVLYQDFFSVIEKDGDLLQAIKEKITILKEYNFQTKDLNHKTINITIEDIRSFFKSLREVKINFYEELLKKYKNRKPSDKNISGWNE